MTRFGPGLRLYAPLLPLLLICLAPLAFVLVKSSELERDMRISVTENMLWVVTQTQMEVMALTIAAAPPAADAATVAQRYDLTLSRLNLLLRGPQARYLDRLGHLAQVEEIAAALRALDPLEQGHSPALHGALHALGQEVYPRFTGIATDVMTHEWDRSAARLDEYRAAQRLVILAVACAFLAALAISALLLRNRIRLHRAELQRLRAAALLEKERDTAALYRDFAAIVSHQMRTPLSLIDSALHRLARRGAAVTAEDVADRQRVVRDAVRRVTRLVDTVLMMGGLDNDQLRGRLGPAPLDRLAGDAIAEARARFPAREITLARGHGPLTALCDPHLVAHILDNLVLNALKYSPAPAPVALRVFAQGGQVACAVTDEGPGIDPADRPHVFDRYFRGRNRQSGEGTGLGLALARELAELQGGRLTLESWPGRGSVFTLWLPAAPADAPSDTPLPADKAPGHVL